MLTLREAFLVSHNNSRIVIFFFKESLQIHQGTFVDEMM